MASISEQKFKEMEAEMNRFEQEISVPKPGSAENKVIIGAGTYSKVQRHLAAIASGGAPPPPPPPLQGSAPRMQGGSPSVNLPMSVSAAPPPPPPPGPGPSTTPSSTLPNLLPPPPPPPIVSARPSFVPHQVRARAPPPPPPPQQQQYPNAPHMSMPPRPPQMSAPPRPQQMSAPPRPPQMSGPPRPPPMSAPPRPPMMTSGNSGQQMAPPRHGPPGQGPGPQYRPPPPPYMDMSGGYYGSQQQPMPRPHAPSLQASPSPVPTNTGVIEKPKVVYSSGPVRAKKPKTEHTESSAATTAAGSSTSVSATTAAAATAKPVTVTPGIELNVPIEQVKMEKAAPSGGVMEADIDGEPAPVSMKKEKREKKKKFIRTAAGQVWEDHSLSDWDPDDFRIFCGDLGNEVTDEVLARAFSKYPSFQKSKIVRDKRTNKTRGFGFVSFKDPNDFVKAMREMNGKYVGNRPIKLRKSTWKERQIDIVKKKDKEKKRLGLK